MAAEHPFPAGGLTKLPRLTLSPKLFATDILGDGRLSARTIRGRGGRKRFTFSCVTMMLILATATGCSLTGAAKPQAGSPVSDKASKSADATSRKIDLAIYLETAELARKRGMDDEAIDQYTRARKLDPKVRGIAHPLAVLYDRAGSCDAAEREYRAALAETREEADVLSDYGYFLYGRGRLEESESMLRRALEKSPSHRQAQINLGLVHGSLGRYDEAQRLFSDAIGPAAALHNVGMLRLRAGDQVGALADLRAASQRDPSLSETRAVIASLANSRPHAPP